MQGIYNYIPETNHVSRVYRFAATVHGTCRPNVISHAECCEPLHQHYPQFVCSAQYGCCLVVA
jgi:hypothetical protein